MANTPIYLCDDEPEVLKSLSFLLRQHGFTVNAYGSGPDLLAAVDAAHKPLRGVFLLDQKMDPMDGHAVHENLRNRGLGKRNPVIFLTGTGTVTKAVAEVQKGALDYLEKPPADDKLVALLHHAVELEAQWQASARRVDFLGDLWKDVSPRQREVAIKVAAGDTNKVIAADMGIGERMVEEHRRQAMEKLGVDAAATLAITISEMRACGVIAPDAN
jgi:two-component system response regulator DctR